MPAQPERCRRGCSLPRSRGIVRITGRLGREVAVVYAMAELSYRRHDEHAVTRRLDEPSVMFGDLRIDQFGPDCFEPLESSVLVDPYEARVACSRVSEPATDRGPVDQR